MRCESTLKDVAHAGIIQSQCCFSKQKKTPKHELFNHIDLYWTTCIWRSLTLVRNWWRNFHSNSYRNKSNDPQQDEYEELGNTRGALILHICTEVNSRFIFVKKWIFFFFGNILNDEIAVFTPKKAQNRRQPKIKFITRQSTQICSLKYA